MACGYPVSDCCRTASWTTLTSLALSGMPLVLLRVSGLPTSLYGLTESRIGPMLVCENKSNQSKRVCVPPHIINASCRLNWRLKDHDACVRVVRIVL